jgi:Cu(I)/Ag(I) efflux system membrane protein CusA/SilA
MLRSRRRPVARLGNEFAPDAQRRHSPLLPVTLPGLSVTKAAELLQTQDRIIKSSPKWRRYSARPARQYRDRSGAGRDDRDGDQSQPEANGGPGMTIEALQAEMDEALRCRHKQRLDHADQARIDMLAAGIRTPVVCGVRA